MSRAAAPRAEIEGGAPRRNARVLVLTSDHLRHQFVINYIAARLVVVGVWQEAKSFAPLRSARDAEEAGAFERHFAARDGAEAVAFGAHRELALAPGTLHRRVAAGGINDERQVAGMVALAPEELLVFGTGLLKGRILEAFAGRILNIHLGLSPYYRGAGTNFWPLVNREPEYVGATIHFLDPGIDTGAIIAHVRPDIEDGDGPHEIGNKAIHAAATVAVAALAAHAAGGVRSEAQAERGRLYQRKDLTGEAVRRLYENFRTGMIAEYLADRPARDAKLRLVSLTPRA